MTLRLENLRGLYCLCIIVVVVAVVVVVVVFSA